LNRRSLLAESISLLDTALAAPRYPLTVLKNPRLKVVWDLYRTAGPSTPRDQLVPFEHAVFPPGATRVHGLPPTFLPPESIPAVSSGVEISGIDFNGRGTFMQGYGTILTVSDFVGGSRTTDESVALVGINADNQVGPMLRMIRGDLDFTPEALPGAPAGGFSGSINAILYIEKCRLTHAPRLMLSWAGNLAVAHCYLRGVGSDGPVTNLEAAHINGGSAHFVESLFGWSGHPPAAGNALIVLDATLPVDVVMDGCILTDVTGLGLDYPIVMTATHGFDCRLTISNTAVQRGKLGYIGKTDIKATDEDSVVSTCLVFDGGGNVDLDTNEPIILGAPASTDPGFSSGIVLQKADLIL
jgi:hypothetical protein